MGDDPVAIAGTAARYIAESEMDVNTVHQIGNDMGLPTATFEDGTNVRTYQAASKGFRHYRNNLKNLADVEEGTEEELSKEDSRRDRDGPDRHRGRGMSKQRLLKSPTKESRKILFHS